MVEGTSERPRRRRREVDDTSKKEVEEIEPPEKIASEVKELDDTIGDTELRVRDAMTELKARESREENISQGLEEAIGELREMESRKETTESKIKEALEELEDPVNDTEPQLRTKKTSNSDSLDDWTVEKRDTRRLYETVHDGPPEVRIESMQDVDKYLEDYPEEKERKRFDEQYRHCKVYFEVKDQHEVRRKDLAKEYNVSHTYIGYWRNGVEPTLIKDLRGREEERIIKEWSESNPQISEEHYKEFRESEKITPKELDDGRTGVHRLNEQVVREATSHLKERDSISKEDIVKTTEKMNQPRLDDSMRIRYGDLQGELTPKKISELQRVLRENRREIEESVSKKLGLENSRARIAVVNEKIYTWTPRVRKDELVGAYEAQFYYFKDKQEVVRIAEELQKRLGIEGNRRESQKQLNELARQMTVGDDGTHTRKMPIGSKIPRLEGKVIRMYLDSSDKRLSELEGRVKKITGINGQAGIDNPKFPEGRKLEVLKARLISIIASDCHLRPSGRINYNEEYPERILRVQEIIREFGDIPLEPSFRRGVYDVHIRNQIGLIVINEGMTPGDKTIQNPGLPESYKHWSEEARGAYLEELICEDGNFNPKSGFSWYRNHALYDSNERRKYEFKSVVTPKEIELIKEKDSQAKGLVPQYELSIGELDRMCKSSDPKRAQTANSLKEAVLNSSNNLIEDEKKIAESLGIEINLRATSVKYYPRSGRVSVKHTATTASTNDAIRWGKMYPPNDERKRKEVEDWLDKIDEKRKRHR